MAIAAGSGGTDLYCHSEPPLTSGKLCFIINFIGGDMGGGQNFYWGPPPLASPLNHPCQSDAVECNLHALLCSTFLDPPLCSVGRALCYNAPQAVAVRTEMLNRISKNRMTLTVFRLNRSLIQCRSVSYCIAVGKQR